MVKPSQLWDFDDAAVLHNGTFNRTLFFQPKMRTRCVVIAEVTCQRSLQMTSAQNDEVVQTFSPNGPDQTLGVGILPWTLSSREHFLDLQRLQTPGNFQPVHAIPISDQVTGRFPICECFDDLLGYPRRGRVIRYVEVQHLAAVMLQHQENKQGWKSIGRRSSKSVKAGVDWLGPSVSGPIRRQPW